ncbi:uncharacterized protein LOC132564195 isoform X1 [Ylistrum balloti]|uniref:uncharacterized protein LOC132564195 isoform X1 n=1 Tax=Ylistrum balloti TaxID=509963 RepID=UPI002905C1B1|nr:uncharacterized protein LOC132564195 isoform X1 [Ylistrum balloti]
MASDQFSVKDFKGSVEEMSIKSVLGIICTKTVSPVPKFLNLIIKNSNAIAGKSFSDASVYLQLNHESGEAAGYISKFPECGLVYMKDILNNSVLEDFQKRGVDAIEMHSDVCRQPFLSLLGFLRGREQHERSLRRLITSTLPTSGNKETQIMVALAQHLFSQLVPGKEYEVDRYAKQLPTKCGCGCKAKICAGNTSLGSERTWHGRVDILLNNTVAVALGKEQTDKCEEEDDGASGEPERKQRKIETGKKCNICVEVKTSRRHENVLLDQKVLEQVIAEAITNGFAQVNSNRSALSHFLIPTIGTTSDHVSICLYDPENDILLYIKEQLELWSPGTKKNQLNVFTIIVIWIFLNFTFLTRKNFAAIVDLDKSGLHADLQQDLYYYKKARAKENFISSTTNEALWKTIVEQPRVPKEPTKDDPPVV